MIICCENTKINADNSAIFENTVMVKIRLGRIALGRHLDFSAGFSIKV